MDLESVLKEHDKVLLNSKLAVGYKVSGMETAVRKTTKAIGGLLITQLSEEICHSFANKFEELAVIEGKELDSLGNFSIKVLSL